MPKEYNQMYQRSSSIYTCLALAASITAVPSMAEEAFFELSLFELQDIPVEVASLFEDSTLDVASSTASISRSEWQNRGAISLGQALEGVPSVFTNTVWGGSEAIAIRGFATELSVRGVAHSLDGIPLGSYTYASPSYLLPRAPLNLLNQVEMIRGPGSTLYGNDAFHGVISMELFNSAVNGGEAIVQAGAPGQYEVSAVNSYNNDKWHVHTGGSIQSDGNHDLEFSYTDPYIENTTSKGSREQGFDNASAFLKIGYGNVSGSRGQFGLSLFRNDFSSNEFQGVGSQFFSRIPLIFDVESSSIAAAGDKSNSQNELTVLGFSHEILLDNDIQLKNHIYNWQSKQEWEFDNSNYPDDLTFSAAFDQPAALAGTTWACKVDGDDTSYNPLFCPHALFQGTEETRMGFSTQVKQAINRFNTQWVVGGGFDKIEITDGRFERINEDGITSQLVTSSYIGSERELGHVLAQARSGFLKNQLLVTYGARWDYYSDVKNHISPRLGLVYKTTDTLTQKLLFGHAYRAPTAVEKFGSGAVLGDINLKSETIETFEFINIYRQHNYEIEAVLFFSEWNNAISLVEVTNVQNQYKNNDSNASKGLEVSVRSKIQSTTINAQTSYTKSENKTDGVDYVAFPEWMGSVNIEHPIKETLKAGVWQRFMLSYQLNDTDTTAKEESYYRTDLYLNWRYDKNLTVIANIQNVFDTENTLPSYYGSEGGLLDYGRIIKASINYKL